MIRIPFYYFLFLLVGTIIIGLEHLLVPVEMRFPLVTTIAGSTYANVQLAAFDARPWLIGFHSLSGLLFAFAIPPQIWPGLRRRRPNLHRISGWVFVVSAWASGVTGVAVALVYPFAGAAAVIPNLVSAIALFGCTITAIRCVRKRDINGHVRWMLRTAAIGLGIVLSRIYLSALIQGLGLPPDDALAQAFWLGSGTNLVLLEIWMHCYGKPLASLG